MSLPPIIGRLVADTSDFAHGMKGVVGIVGGAFAAVGAAKFLGGALDEMEEAQKVSRQTAATIKSTGGAANVSAKQVDDLATSLSNMAGIDDEVIASSENVLMTFTAVKNQVGKGNDVFNQATKAALNMSVAMGSDLQTATVQVGKALNDPIKGVGALRKVGVALTEQQEKSIKTMVDQGDTMGAQKVILKELETQFGGSAEAQATATAKMRVAWGNLQESAGKALAPLIEFVAGLAPKVFASLERLGGTVARFAAQFREAFTTFTNVGEWEAHGPFEKIGVAAAKAVEGVKSFVNTLRTGFTEDEGTPVESVALRLRDFSQAAVAWAQAAWPRVKEIITEALTTVQSVISGVVDIVMAIWNNFGTQIVAVLQGAWDLVMSIVDAAMNVIRGVIDVVAGLITGDWTRVWEGIKSIFSGVWDAIKAIVEAAMVLIQNVISVAWEIVKGIFTGAWEAIKTGTANAIGAVVDLVASLPGRALSALGDLGGLLYNAGRKLIMGFVDGIVSAIGAVKDTLTGLVGKLTSWKGPPAKDAKLLWGAGQLVIGGFIGGMESRYGDVKDSLGGVTGMIGSSGSALIGGGGGEPTIIINNAGSVISEKDLVAQIEAGLADRSRHGPLGFAA